MLVHIIAATLDGQKDHRTNEGVAEEQGANAKVCC